MQSNPRILVLGGLNMGLIGRVGDDLFGPALLDALRRDGIDVGDVAVDPQHATGAGVIIVDGSGQNYIVAAYGANLQCDGAQLQAVKRHLDDADVLMLQMEVPFEVSTEAAVAAKKRGVHVILDPAPASKIPDVAYHHLHIIAPNQTEAEIHTGVVVDDVASAREAAEILLDRGVAVAIIKMAELGAFYATGDEAGHVPPFPAQAVDTTSAGDAFHGALAVGLAEGKSLAAAVRFGAAAGALAVTRPGVQDSMPRRAEVEILYSASS